jgi:predicted tellurium resistance membrane protein TerC
MPTPEQKKKNLTLGLILASVVLVFFIGFIVRLTYFGAPKKPQVIPSMPAATAVPANKS